MYTLCWVLGKKNGFTCKLLAMGFFNSRRHSNRLRKLVKKLSKNKNLRLFLGESVSTMIAVFLSLACFAQIYFGNALDLGIGLKQNKSAQSLLSIPVSYGTWLNYAIGTGIGYAVATASVSSVKDAHLNPAITVAAVMSDLKDTFTWSQMPVFFAGQCLGGLLAGALLYSIYLVPLRDVMQDPRDNGESRRLFGSYPMPPNRDTPTIVLCWDQVFSTAIIIMVYLVCHDPDPDGFLNSKFAPSFSPIFSGLGITLVLLTNGVVAAANINPARDLPPRFISYFIFGDDVWRLPKEEGQEEMDDGGYRYFFWIPMLLPYVGAIFGTFVYAIAVAFHRSSVREKRKRHVMKKLRMAEKKIKKITVDLAEVRRDQMKEQGNLYVGYF